MAVHARDFNRTHPSADANHASVLAKLEETITQMEALAAQQVTGVVSKGSSTCAARTSAAGCTTGCCGTW